MLGRGAVTNRLFIGILLATALALMEGLSITGLIPQFHLPSSTILELVILTASITSVLGLLVAGRIGTGLGLLAAAYEAVLGSLSFMLHRPALFSSQGLRDVTAIPLGILTFLAIRSSTTQLLAKPMHEELQLTEYSVVVDHAFKTFGEGAAQVQAVRDLSLKVRKGEFLAIMGPSGSGKSTLLNLLGALDRPSSGKVLIDGVDISTLDEDELAHIRNDELGFVFQSYNLVQRSKVSRNIELPALVGGLSREERSRRVETLLKAVNLPTMADRRPNVLSGGEQQRVAIARALMNRPSIILADEPTGNLDSKSAREVMDFLLKMRSETKATMIMVTHNKELAGAADRIVYLEDGSVVGEDVLRGASNIE